MNDRTFFELLDEFINHLQSRNFSRYTVKAVYYCNKECFDWLKDKRQVVVPARLRRNHLEDWQKHISLKTTYKGRPLKPRSVNKHIETVKSFVKYLANRGYISRHLEYVLEYIKEPKMLPGSVLTHMQSRKMLESISTDNPESYRNRTIMELLYSSGIRAGELVRLNTVDVDFYNATALVHGKGEKDRVVPIGKTALMFIENYIKAVRPFQLKDREEKALFLDRYGKRFPYHTLRRTILALAEKAGVDTHVTAHTFRRSCTTELLRGGAGMYHVKELLGHESLETIKHYAKLTIGDLKKEHQRCHPREKDFRKHIDIV